MLKKGKPKKQEFKIGDRVRNIIFNCIGHIVEIYQEMEGARVRREDNGYVTYNRLKNLVKLSPESSYELYKKSIIDPRD